MTFEELEKQRELRIEQHKKEGFLLSERIKGIKMFFKMLGYTKSHEKETHYETIYHLHWTKRIFSNFTANYTDVWQGKYITIPKYHNRLIRFIFGTRYYQYFYMALGYNGEEHGRHGTDWTKKANFFDFNGKKGFEKYKEGEDYKDEVLEFYKIEYNGWLFGKKSLEAEWNSWMNFMIKIPHYD